MLGKNNKNLNRGFTLVELSIVLVIIGLIVASVLVGQDLIRQAELRATVSQYEQFSTAMKTFKTKYNQIPGDISNATSFGLSNNGDGDEVLADAAFTAGYTSDDERGTHDDEYVFFWNHLGTAGAGLISGNFDGGAVTTTDIANSAPAAKSGDYWGVYSDDGSNFFIIGAALSSASNNYTTVDSLAPIDANSIDTKIDDGRPSRGIITGRDGAAANPHTSIDGAGADACATGTAATDTYATTITVKTCTLSIRIR